MYKSKFLSLALVGLLMLSTAPVSADIKTSDGSQSTPNSESTPSSDITKSSNEPTLALSSSTTLKDIPSTEASSNSNSNSNLNSTSQTETTSASPTIRASTTEASPNTATVTTESEFWSAIANQSITTILLASDIVANPLNRVSSESPAGSIQRNLIIDGQNHNLSYDTTAYTSQILYAGISGIDVTFQNLSMGSTAYPNNNYYGIFTINQSNVSLNIRNFSYYAANGGQPFYANGNTGSIINFYGANTFNSNGSNSGGEFVERFLTVNFKSGSNTSVYNDTPSSTAIFYSSGSMVLNLESNAKLNIKSSKNAFSYGTTTVNLQDNSYLGYEAFYGTNYKVTSPQITNSSTATFNGGLNSEIDFTSNEYPLNVSSTTINSNAMKAVYVKNNLNKVATTSNLVLKRTDSLPSQYDLNALSLDGIQSKPVSNIAYNSSLTISPTTYNNGKSFLYTNQPSINSANFNSQVGDSLSNLNATISTDFDYRKNVKVSNTRLYSDGNINSSDSQTAINTAAITPTVITTNDSTPISSDIPGGKTLYVYYNAQSGSSFDGYTIQSNWAESVVVQSKYSSLSFPDSAIMFSQPITGPFEMSSAYLVKNLGNVPVNIKPNAISDTNTNVKLVENSFSSDQQVMLSLHGVSSTSSHDWNFKNPDSTTLVINPYFTDSNSVNYSINGNYSGPLIGIQNVSYKITFNWAQ